MEEITYNQYGKEVLDGLAKGAFLNVTHQGEVNTMTIGWGSMGFIWRKPVIMVMVRYSRHTYQMLEATEEFTVSIPFGDQFKKQLAFCGSHSGRDTSKIEACNLTTIPGHKVDAPLINGCNIHYECKVLYKQTMEPGTLDPELKNKFYKNNDYHVLFYGEILGTYLE